jgi:hypothetical protein
MGKTQRNLRSRFQFRFVESLVFKLVVALGGWLKSHSLERWKKAVAELSEIEPRAQVIPIQSSAELYKTEYLSKPSYEGFEEDSRSHINRVFDLPAWAKEIQPFLANQLSIHTRRAYETDLKQFFRYLEGRIDPHNLTSLKPEHIILFRKQLE